MTDVASAELDAAQNAILSDVTTYYLSLHTADPGQTGAHEGTDGRQAITFAASSGGSQDSSDGQTWSSAAGGQTYGYFGIWTAASGGSYLRGGSLASSITPPAGAEIVFASGAITLTAS
jgi:hypothetical protein